MQTYPDIASFKKSELIKCPTLSTPPTSSPTHTFYSRLVCPPPPRAIPCANPLETAGRALKASRDPRRKGGSSSRGTFPRPRPAPPSHLRARPLREGLRVRSPEGVAAPTHRRLGVAKVVVPPDRQQRARPISCTWRAQLAGPRCGHTPLFYSGRRLWAAPRAGAPGITSRPQ